MSVSLFHIPFYALLSQAVLFSGLTIALLLWLAQTQNKVASRFLSLGLVVILMKVSGIAPLLLVASGPFLYFYVRALIRPDRRLDLKDGLHFLPLMVGYWLPQPLILLLVIVYLFLSHRLIQQFYYGLQPVLMDKPRFAFRGLNSALGLFGLLCVLSLFNNNFYFAIAFVMIGIAMDTILKPDSGNQLVTTGADRANARREGRRLKETVAANRLYVDAELTLTTLAVKLSLHPHDLSRIINIGLKKNFSDFINEFRVREVVRKMQDPGYDRLKLLGIAYESGFNSERTFHRVFKEMTGKTPLEYKNSLKKELPIDNLATLSRVRPVILRSESPPIWAPEKLKRNYMFKNYFTSAVRSLKRYKLFTLLNMFGLGTGMACSMLILLWVQDEYSYDKFNDKAAELYRLTSVIPGNELASSPLPVAVAAKKGLAAVENFARLVPLKSIVTIGHTKFDEKNIYYTDPSFLQMFSYRLQWGDNSGLSRPDGTIITATTARRYFGSQNAIGKTIHIDDDVRGHDYLVTGVLRDIPHNSHLQFDVLLPISVFEKSSNYNPASGWGNFDVYTYLQLHDGVNKAQLEKQITAIHTAGDATHSKMTFVLQPLTSIHLHSHFLQDIDGQGNSTYVNIFLLIAAFVLFIACINFMNLSTALAGQRAKEVGLRKTIGALRSQLITQFMGEAFLVTIISLLLGSGISWLCLPLFNEISAKAIQINLMSVPIILALLGITVLVGLISGSYPAFFLSSFRPVSVLKGVKIFEGQKNTFRNGLVVVQFVISVVLIISTLVVNSQLKFIRNRDIGFNKENLLYVQMPQTGDLQNNYQALKGVLGNNAGTMDYTIIENLPTNLESGTTDVKWSGKDPAQQIVFPRLGIDQHFIKTFGMQLVAGRTFDDNNPADRSNFVLNETAIKTMGLNSSSAIGQKITVRGNTGEVIGIVKDFNFKPVQKRIEPLILKYTAKGGFVVIRTSPEKMERIIVKLKTAFQNVYPSFPFTYGFVDQDLSRLYLTEQQIGKLFNVFSVISIIISCLGLFGLAAFATQRRLKEIGVRRVLGASAPDIVMMLAKDFLKLVTAALFIAFPGAWWAMNRWLDDYAYRIQMSWWMFAAAGVLTIVIAFLTISFQSIKAALANPVDSLRSE